MGQKLSTQYEVTFSATCMQKVDVTVVDLCNRNFYGDHQTVMALSVKF